MQYRTIEEYEIVISNNIFNMITKIEVGITGLHIKGYEWKFKEGLSDKASQNLDKALIEMKKKLSNPDELINSFTDFKNEVQ